jgi:hypothetical protein
MTHRKRGAACHKCGTPLATRQPPAPPACHARLCTTTGGRGTQASWTRGAKLTSFAARLPFDAASMLATRRCLCGWETGGVVTKKSEGDIRIILTTITTKVDNCSRTGLQVYCTGNRAWCGSSAAAAVWYPFWGELVPEWTALMGNQEALLMPSGSDSNNLLSKFCASICVLRYRNCCHGIRSHSLTSGWSLAHSLTHSLTRSFACFAAACRSRVVFDLPQATPIDVSGPDQLVSEVCAPRSECTPQLHDRTPTAPLVTCRPRPALFVVGSLPIFSR